MTDQTGWWECAKGAAGLRTFATLGFPRAASPVVLRAFVHGTAVMVLHRLGMHRTTKSSTEPRAHTPNGTGEGPRGWTAIPHRTVLAAIAWSLSSVAAMAETYSVPLFLSASNALQQGFVQIINRSDASGAVTVHAIDDTGQRRHCRTTATAGVRAKDCTSG